MKQTYQALPTRVVADDVVYAREIFDRLGEPLAGVARQRLADDFNWTVDHFAVAFRHHLLTAREANLALCVMHGVRSALTIGEPPCLRPYYARSMSSVNDLVYLARVRASLYN